MPLSVSVISTHPDRPCVMSYTSDYTMSILDSETRDKHGDGDDDDDELVTCFPMNKEMSCLEKRNSFSKPYGGLVDKVYIQNWW